MKMEETNRWKEKIQNTERNKKKKDLYKRKYCKWRGGNGGHETAQGQVTDDAKPHSKNGTFVVKKKIQTYGEIQTMMNHILQCVLKGTSCEKNDLYQANDETPAVTAF